MNRDLRPLLGGALLTFLLGCDTPAVRVLPSEALPDTVPVSPPPEDTVGKSPDPDPPPTSFVVASDVHFLSPRLVGQPLSPSLKSYISGDRKLILQGPGLLHSWLDSIRAMDPIFVLITGDLTKDGEKASHEDLADSLQTLIDRGIQVVVLPGNHDVGMQGTVAYPSSGTAATPWVSASEFASIYARCGYAQALSRDPGSLSYLVQVAPGIRVLALDGCSYKDQGSSTSRSCNFLPETTLSWAEKALASSRESGQVVVGAIHFGTIPHFQGQDVEPVGSGYVLGGAQTAIPRLARAGLRVIFTGHFHANDIASVQVEGATWTDIETGSLVTPPCAFRFGTISQGKISVRSGRIREIPDDLGGRPFPVFADSALYANMLGKSSAILSGYYGVGDSAQSGSSLLAEAWMTHYAGDEPRQLPYSTQARLLRWESSQVPSMTKAASVIRSFYTDIGPADSAGTFDLR